MRECGQGCVDEGVWTGVCADEGVWTRVCR